MSIKGFEVGGVQERYDYTALDNTPANLVQDANYVHTDNNFTNADKTKLDGIATGANKTIIDATLTQSGQAADAKATGDELEDLRSAFTANLIHDTATGSIANFPDGAALPVRDLSVDIEPAQAGSGDPSPDNIRPISGHDSATVTRTGKNLCDSAAFESGLLATAIGSDINAVTSSTRYAHSGIMPAKSALAVTVKTLDLTKIEYASVVAYVGDKVAWTAAQSFSSSVMSKTWTIPANTYEKLRINIGAPSGVVADVANTEVQVEVGSTATAYEPYSGETYTITFPSEAGTVYGGTLDVTTGKLTVTDGYIASYNGETLPSTWISDRDVYAVGANPTTGAQVVYKLATPTVYDLDPVTIETLLGTNNIFADCGDTTVDYYADPTLYINRKIAAAVAAMS